VNDETVVFITCPHMKSNEVTSVARYRPFVKYRIPFLLSSPMQIVLQAVSVRSDITQRAYPHSAELSEQSESEHDIRLKGLLSSMTSPLCSCF